MKKNGFTLVELLGVITVLAIVMGIVSVAYIGITKQTDLAYYRSLEESLLLSGGEYFSYSKDNQPKLLGEENKINVKYLVENQYIEAVKDRKGNSCEEDSYVSAYKDSALKTNYYVCLVCNNYKTESDACLGIANYELQVEVKTKETKKTYYPNAGVFSSENIVLTFKTLADIETIYLENEDKSSVKSCVLKEENGIKTCSIEVTQSDKYKYYGESADQTQKTREKDLEILIDLTPPEFSVEEEGPIEIDIETLSGEMSNRIYEIKDLESGIKNIRYSFEKENEEKFQDTVIKEEFSVSKELDRGNYKLIVEVTNNALLKTTKEVNYIVYGKVDIPLASEVCLDNLIYNGTSQTITKTISDSSSYTYLNNKKTDAGDHIVQVQLKDNYYWIDGTNANKQITCNIKRKEVTVKANDQTIVFGNSISKTVNDVTATGLVNSHVVTSISLSQSVTTVTNNGTIIPSGAVIKSETTDVTSNYDIKYQNGTLVINTIPLSGGKVVIKGEATYGETLTATLTETTPTASYSYAWYVSDTNTTTGGTKVSSSNSLVLADNTFDKYVYLVVTATKDNYTTKTITDITDATNNNTAKVVARKLVVTAGTSSRVYNGSALTNSSCTADNLAFSHTVSCTMTSNSTITNVGSVTNTISEVKLLGSSGTTSVNKYYDITTKTGKLTVESSPTAKVGSCSNKIYNGAKQTIATNGTNTLISGHEQTEVGNYTITYTSKDNYTFSDGTTKKTLTCSIKGEKPTVTISISGDSDTCSNSYLKGAKATVTCTSSLPITAFSGKVGSTSGTESGDDYTKTATINLSSTGSKTINASCENSLGTTTLDKSVSIKVYTASSSCDCKTRYTASTAGTTCSRCSSWSTYSNFSYSGQTSNPSDYCYVSSSTFYKKDYKTFESYTSGSSTLIKGTGIIYKCASFACQTYKTCCHT